MTTGLQFNYLYHDNDVIEVRMFAWNGRFGGTADVYVALGQLSEAAATLGGFPQQSSDTRKLYFGAPGPGFAGGGVGLRFYCKDLAGHPVVEATIKARYSKSKTTESATVISAFEPVALDLFLAELQQLDKDCRGSAQLRLLRIRAVDS